RNLNRGKEEWFAGGPGGEDGAKCIRHRSGGATMYPSGQPPAEASPGAWTCRGPPNRAEIARLFPLDLFSQSAPCIRAHPIGFVLPKSGMTRSDQFGRGSHDYKKRLMSPYGFA